MFHESQQFHIGRFKKPQTVPQGFLSHRDVFLPELVNVYGVPLIKEPYLKQNISATILIANSLGYFNCLKLIASEIPLQTSSLSDFTIAQPPMKSLLTRSMYKTIQDLSVVKQIHNKILLEQQSRNANDEDWTLPIPKPIPNFNQKQPTNLHKPIPLSLNKTCAHHISASFCGVIAAHSGFDCIYS